MGKDNIYSLPQQRVGDFAFDDAVVEVFPDMIARSVPGYASMLAMIEQLAVRFAQPETHLYDLGASLGAATFLIRQQAPSNCTIHAVDNSPAMVKRLRAKLQDELAAKRELCSVEVHQADVCGFEIVNASLVVLNLTLQFVPAEKRAGLLRSVMKGLNPGGALLLSEKICFEDAPQQQLLTQLHHDFKRAHGYSELEIAQKRTALENTLLPETLENHLARLKSVGFAIVAPWFQCFNFVSVLAVKG